jgi:hypothetical protein
MRDSAIPRWLRVAGMGSWCGLLALSAVALPAVFQGGSLNRWPELTEALVSGNDHGWPIVTFSNGGIVSDYISVYGRGRLQGARVITVVDGPYEDAVGADWLKARGLTQADVEAGALAAALPAHDPANDAVWFVEHFGGETVREEFAKLGYDRVYAAGYYKAALELYVRPGAPIGRPVALNGTFAGDNDVADGWSLPEDLFALRPLGSEGRELLLFSGDSPARARLRVPASAGMYLLDTSYRAPADAEGNVVLTCESGLGDRLASFKRPLAETDAGTGRLKVAIQCPKETARLLITLERSGVTEVAFSDLQLYEA